MRGGKQENRWCYVSGAAEDYHLSTSFSAKQVDVPPFFFFLQQLKPKICCSEISAPYHLKDFWKHVHECSFLFSLSYDSLIEATAYKNINKFSIPL